MQRFTRSLWLGILLALPPLLPIYQWRFSLAGIPTNALELIVTIGIICVFSSFLLSPPKSHLPFYPQRSLGRSGTLISPLPLGSLLILLGALLGLTQSTDILSSLGIIKSYLILPALFFWTTRLVLADTAMRQRFFRFLPFSLALATMWMTKIALLQKLELWSIPFAWQKELRSTGPFPYPNALGHVLAPMAAFAIAWLAHSGKKVADEIRRTSLSARAALMVTILFGVLGTTLAQTESALLALIVVTGLLVVLRLPRHWRLWTIGLGAVCVIGLIATQPFVQEKLFLNDWSGKTRRAIWSETWQGLTSGPTYFVFGFGPDQYPTAIAPFHTHTYLEIFQYPHQLFLNIWVEFGLLGLCGFLLMVFGLIKHLPSKNVYQFAALFALLEMIVHGLVDVPFLKNDLVLLTALFVMITTCSVADSPPLPRSHTSQ